MSQQFLLDAFGGGKRPTKPTPKRVIRQRSRSRSRSRSPVPTIHDDDAPPTQLLDNYVPGRDSKFGSPMVESPHRFSSPSTPMLSYETQVTIIGYPPEEEHQIMELMHDCGTIQSKKKSGNWMVVNFVSPLACTKALQLDGQLLNDTALLVIKPGDHTPKHIKMDEHHRPLPPKLQVTQKLEDQPVSPVEYEPVHVPNVKDATRPAGFWTMIMDFLFGF
ncbi:hypothetical protein EDD86DRAFT_98232 [Gorgonomyces haynaldii]|nr:hypothetical protein EDD86DRAFT_98232 [Gorgonomyces haynaldii]